MAMTATVLEMVDQPFEVFGEAPVASDPAEGPFDHPASRDLLEAFGMRRSFYDLQQEPSADCTARTLIAGIGKQACQPGELPFDPVAGQGQTITILDVGRCTARFRGKPRVSVTRCRLRPLIFLPAS